jgi:hypothetical protein
VSGVRLITVITANGQWLGRISSASPQLGAAKRGQEAGVAPGRSTPIRPRALPPGPAGAPWRAKRKAVNDRQSQAHRNREAIAIDNVCTGLVSLPIFHSRTLKPQGRCVSHHLFQTLPLGRHLVPWHLIQTRRHCRYFEHILSTPRSVKWDHIVTIDGVVAVVFMSWAPSRGLTLWLRGLRGG